MEGSTVMMLHAFAIRLTLMRTKSTKNSPDIALKANIVDSKNSSGKPHKLPRKRKLRSKIANVQLSASACRRRDKSLHRLNACSVRRTKLRGLRSVKLSKRRRLSSVQN